MSLKKNLMGLFSSAIMASERVLRGPIMPRAAERVNSVLILEYMLPLGCCVHLTPVYEAIKRARPEMTITVATRGLGLALLRHNRSIDHLIETSDPLQSIFAAVKALCAGLARRNLHPDCTFTGASDQRTRIALLALLAGAGWRGGFSLAPQLYHRPLTYEPGLSLIDNNLRLAGLIGCEIEQIEPRVFFSSADAAAATVMTRQANPEGKPLLVMVTQNSGGQSTGWHNERFVQVIRHAHEVLGCAIVYVGTGADTEAVEQLRQEAGGLGTSLTGSTTVTELAAVLALSDVVVSLDTGTMHIGRAVGVPMVVLGPSWQKPIEWMPLQIRNVRILRAEDRTEVPQGYRLDEVQAEDVIAALTELLDAYPAGAAPRAERLRASMSEVDHRKTQQDYFDNEN
jgi:ADP-heptose:LPS heptosyltransferase